VGQDAGAAYVTSCAATDKRDAAAASKNRTQLSGTRLSPHGVHAEGLC
jgi:hypothetical protein